MATKSRRFSSSAASESDSKQLSFLNVNLVSAAGLKDVRMFSKMSPYAVAWVDPSMKICTHVAKHMGKDPVWDYRCCVPLPPDALTDDGSTLTIQVHNHRSKEPASDEMLGSVTIPLSEIITRNNPRDLEFITCELLRPSGRIQGLLNFSAVLKGYPRTPKDNTNRTTIYQPTNAAGSPTKHRHGKAAYINGNELPNADFQISQIPIPSVKTGSQPNNPALTNSSRLASSTSYSAQKTKSKVNTGSSRSTTTNTPKLSPRQQFAIAASSHRPRMSSHNHQLKHVHNYMHHREIVPVRDALDLHHGEPARHKHVQNHQYHGQGEYHNHHRDMIHVRDDLDFYHRESNPYSSRSGDGHSQSSLRGSAHPVHAGCDQEGHDRYTDEVGAMILADQFLSHQISDYGGDGGDGGF